MSAPRSRAYWMLFTTCPVAGSARWTSERRRLTIQTALGVRVISRMPPRVRWSLMRSRERTSASFFVSTIGWGIFRYGKKQERVPQIVCGLALMVYPYFTPGAWPLLGAGAAIAVGLWYVVRLGY